MSSREYEAGIHIYDSRSMYLLQLKFNDLPTLLVLIEEYKFSSSTKVSLPSSIFPAP